MHARWPTLPREPLQDHIVPLHRPLQVCTPNGSALTVACAVKACYSHTEGAAGITGMLLAAESLSRAAAPPIVNLRIVNPYVAAALSDWQSQKCLTPQAPRQLSPAPLIQVCAQTMPGACNGPPPQRFHPQALVMLPIMPLTRYLPVAVQGTVDKPGAAGSSSFGMSGINAHVIVAASPVRDAPSGACASKDQPGRPDMAADTDAGHASSTRAPATLQHRGVEPEEALCGLLQTFHVPSWATCMTTR